MARSKSPPGAPGRRCNGAPRRSRAFLYGAIGSVMLTLSCMADALAADHTVVIEQMRFDPPTLTVHTGDRVTWINKDWVPHTASARSNAFDSHDIPANASWTYVADRPGNYPYLCHYHPMMSGSLTVR